MFDVERWRLRTTWGLPRRFEKNEEYHRRIALMLFSLREPRFIPMQVVYGSNIHPYLIILITLHF